MPKVSVIVPVYNVEKYVLRCLSSLENQTLQDIEIIVVNDGSKDKSKELILKFKENYNNIVYVEKENGGLSDARNYGMNFAKGEYIAFLDADDFVDYTTYEKMYKKAIEEKADYVECDFYWAYHIEKDKWNNKKDIGYRYHDKKEMFEKGRVIAWNKLINRTSIKHEFPVGLLYEDVEFFYKLIPDINKFAFVEEPLIYYVQREDSIIKKQNYKTSQIFNVLSNVIDYYKKNNLYEEYKEQIEYTYARILLCSSLKRVAKVEDKVAREKLYYETWQNLYTKFPEWKKNTLLKKFSGKNLYMRCINKYTYKIVCKLFEKIKTN